MLDAKNLEVVTAAANVLGTMQVQEISSEYHLELLEYLCDEVLTSEEIRSVIQSEHAQAYLNDLSTSCAIATVLQLLQLGKETVGCQLQMEQTPSCSDCFCMCAEKIDTTDTLNRDMRTELAEGKQKLRELLDAQKEEKKRKREGQATVNKSAIVLNVSHNEHADNLPSVSFLPK